MANRSSMAAAIPNVIPRAISQRGKNQLEIERENFERSQAASAAKAINSVESPVKEKHVRTLIIGTHKEHNGNMFWSLATKQPLQGHPIVCWKFCHVLHKVLREGHGQVIVDSLKYRGYMKDLGKLWGHLREGYGKLIAFYTKLLICKLTFHGKYPSIAGNLMMDDEELDKLCGSDVNSYFELSVDMLDYMDDILALQSHVFGSLDMSRSNSMTSMGQCRLAPLILCIQDSCQLYDYIVKILFRLHSSLPPDTLGGHRDRFYNQYKALKKFYYSSSNLQYFKNLIKVPHLPESPPNFLHASDLQSHVKPVAIVPDPEPEATTPADEVATDLLIDTTSEFSDDSSRFEDSMGFEDSFGQNGAPSPPVPDDKDLLIQQLMREINELKQEVARIKGEGSMMIESLQNRIKELENELQTFRQIGESTQQENETLRNMLKEKEDNAEVIAQMDQFEKIAKANEEKFKKMKDIYTKLREEHVNLIRAHAEAKKQGEAAKRSRDEMDQKQTELSQELALLQCEKSKMEATLLQSSSETSKVAELEQSQNQIRQDKEDVEKQLRDVAAAKAALDAALLQCQGDVAALRAQLDDSRRDKDQAENVFKQQVLDRGLQLLVKAVEEGEAIIKDGLAQCDNPNHATVTCTSEYLLNRTEPVLRSLEALQTSYTQYSTDKEAVAEVVKGVCNFSHHMADMVVHGKATSNASPIEQGEALTNLSKTCGEESLVLLGHIKSGDESALRGQSEKLSGFIRRLVALGEELLPKVEDAKAENMGDLIDQEMEETQKAIESASKRFADMLAQSRQAQTGIQLEVNERILDSCNDLMTAIKVLINKSKVLQREIVAQGRGSTSATEFYKKHHRWTEGLISAAKAVGWGANVLVDSADKVVKGEGKYEELVVCSQEIAASTTQLVVASKVKAERKSENLQPLSEASKGVTQAAAQVVASAKSAAEAIEESDTLDFSKLTLHQAKRLEMEAQVRVLEFESNLEKERVHLAELRRKHYQLAGEAEGWEQEDIDSQA